MSGIGSLLLSAQQLGFVPVEEERDLALIYGAFVFPLQLLEAVLAFYGRETLGATTKDTGPAFR